MKGNAGMKFTDNHLHRISEETKKLLEEIFVLPSLGLSALDPHKTIAVFVDIVNGFIRTGAMADGRIEDIIDPNVRLMKMCEGAGILTAAFADCHKKDAAEFLSFPPHCIEGTEESQLVRELKNAGNCLIIPKNSTNGFHEDKFKSLLECHPKTDTFIVTGDCTDICVLQLCLCLKTYFTQKNIPVSVIVPIDCVETYDASYHSSDFANLAAYKLMKDSGIRFVSRITE